jgi:hypothetical protein
MVKVIPLDNSYHPPCRTIASNCSNSTLAIVRNKATTIADFSRAVDAGASVSCEDRVIASRIGATPEMITHEKDGFLVPQGDDWAILDKLMILARSIDARRRIGDAARRTAQRRFDISITFAAHFATPC